MRWGTGRVADLEAGRVSPTLPTLLALCQALSDVTGQPVALADLLAGSGAVDVGDVAAPLASVRTALRGAPVELQGESTLAALKRSFLRQLAERTDEQLAPRHKGQLWLIHRQYGEAEERAARQLDVTKTALLEAMRALWGQALSVERDKRAGAGASPQTKGRITRALKTELKTYFQENDGDY